MRLRLFLLASPKSTTDEARFVASMAKLMIDKHGFGAGVISASMSDRRYALGDSEGGRVWQEVLKEVRRLQAP